MTGKIVNGTAGGGSYEVRDGKFVQLEAPTQDHPEGNRPRDAQGRALDLPAPEATPAAAEPADNGKMFFRRQPKE